MHSGDIVLIGVVAIVGLLLMTPIFLIAYGMIKKKYRLAKTTAIATAIVILAGMLFHFVFPTHFPYVDSWVYGKTKEQIIEVYGEPVYNSKSVIGYYVGEDNGVWGLGMMDSNDQYFYYVLFDDQENANKIFITIQMGG